MAAPLPTRTRRIATLALALFGVLGVELFKPETAPDELLVFAMSVETDDGRVIGSPVVVGSPGQRVEVSLRCERNPDLEKMSLVLDPISSADDGSMRFNYSLSVGGRMRSERGTVELMPGRERSIAVRPDDPRRSVKLALYTAPVSFPGVSRYLRARKARLAATET